MKKMTAICISFLSVVVSYAQRVPDNVVISEAFEEYTIEDGRDGMVVKTIERTKYEATRHSDKVVPHVFYNNVISLDKVSGGKPDRRNVNSPNVFHDDSYICYFPVELKQKGATAKAEFRRTFKDPAHFTRIMLTDVYPVRQKTVKFNIPPQHNDIELIELNLPENSFVRNEVVNLDGSLTITFDFKDLPGIGKDESSPVPLACEPHILVKGYFKGLDDLHDYHRRMLDVDTVIPDLPKIMADVTGGAVERSEVIKNIYRYVQQKVRYVAYEEGEAGFRPDKPSEVLRKQYGDCKGMALLIATLLNRAGVEAYIACIGTRRIPFRIADCPSLAATNHMICIAPAVGDTLYLDATYEHISSRDIPSGIQGKDAMMFKESGYEMIEVPRRSPDDVSEESLFEYEICDQSLTGRASRRYSGDMLEMMSTRLQSLGRTYKNDALAFMVRPRKDVSVDKEGLKAEYVSDGVYEISARLTAGNSLTSVGDVMYVDMGSTTGGFVDRVDLTDRRQDLELPFRSKVVARSVLKMPEGYRAGELPGDFHAECCGVGFDCRFYADESGAVCVEKSAVISDTRVPLAALGDWNKAVSAWNEASSHQVELVKVAANE